MGSVSNQARISTPGDISPLGWLAIVLAFAPIPLKRLVLTGEPELATWLIWDYGARCVMLLGVALAYRARLAGVSRPLAGWQTAANVFAVMLVLQLAQQALIYPWFHANLSVFKTFAYPTIHAPLLFTVDLFAGMMLVAASEELAFRRVAFALLQRRGVSPVATIVATSVAFAMIHWTSGLDNVANAFVLGVILGTAFHLTRRIGVAIALHYIDDVLVFGGVL